MKYDIAIIGAGPGGYTAAFKAADEGLSVVIFEKDRFGGTCLNRGCVPTKALLKSANATCKRQYRPSWTTPNGACRYRPTASWASNNTNPTRAPR